MSGFWVVLAKECRDNLRDRRTIISSLSLAIAGPALFVGLMAFVLETTLGEAQAGFTLTVVGSEHAPELMAHLERHNVELTRIELDAPREAVLDGRHALVLVVPADYPERFRSGQITTLALIHDGSRMGSGNRNYFAARQLIAAHAQKIGMLRLQLRGIDPAVLSPLLVSEIDVSSPAARALTILATLPYFLVLVIFMGGFYLAIDATAGEREHGSLEPLLSQPISRTQLVLGKISAASAFSLLSVVLFVVSLALSLPWVPLHKAGMSLTIDAVTCLQILAVALPLIVFGAALLTVVASFAKSYKEAQTYLTLVIIVPTAPLIVTQLLNIEPSAPLMLVPSLSQASLITAFIEGAPLPWSYAAISAAATTLLAALVAWLAVSLYRRERILI